MGGHIEGKWKIVRWSENRLHLAVQQASTDLDKSSFHGA